MYFLPGLLNSRGLFQRLGTLQRDARVEEEVEEILYRCSVIALSWNRAAEQRARCMEEFRRHRPSLTLDHEPVLFFSQNLIEAVGSLTTVMDELKIVQDKLVPLLWKVQDLKQDAPHNLRNCMKPATVKRIRAAGFSEDVLGLLVEYWSAFGQEVANYRDIDQHHYAMVNSAVMYFDPKEDLRVLLPDDSKTHGRAKATFRIGVDAYRLLWDAFRSMERVLDRCLSALNIRPMPLWMPTSLNPHVLNEPVPMSRPRTMALLVGGGRDKGDLSRQVRFTAEGRLETDEFGPTEPSGTLSTPPATASSAPAVLPAPDATDREP